jgi:hypothetical protein
MKWNRSEVICAFGKCPRHTAAVQHRARLPGAAAGLRPHAMTVQPAQGQDGRTWPPGFAAGAEHRWSDAETACDLIEANAQRTD